MRTERAAVPVAQPGVTSRLAAQRGGHVALGVLRCDEHQRDHSELAVPRGDELFDGLAQRWRRQLDKPAGDVAQRPPSDQVDQRMELGDAGAAAGAMPDDEQRRHDTSA